MSALHLHAEPAVVDVEQVAGLRCPSLRPLHPRSIDSHCQPRIPTPPQIASQTCQTRALCPHEGSKDQRACAADTPALRWMQMGDDLLADQSQHPLRFVSPAFAPVRADGVDE